MPGISNTQEKVASTAGAWQVQSWLSDELTPLALFERLSTPGAPAFLLESVEQDSRLARFSLLGVEPCASVTLQGRHAELTGQANPNAPETLELPRRPLAILDALQQRWLKEKPPPPACVAHLPLLAGWVGAAGYGLTQALENIPQQANDPFKLPDGWYGFYPAVWVFDHRERRLWFIALKLDTMSESAWQQVLQQPERAFESRASSSSPLQLPLSGLVKLDKQELFQTWQTAESAEAFQQKVLDCKELVAQGEVFQIVLSQRFWREYSASPLTAYRVLQAMNPSPYAFYLQGPDWTYLGASPETFLSGSRSGQLMLKALAGTRPRGATAEEDERLAAELKADQKEVAEHKMLVDLGRNDLGRCCELNSIQVGDVAQVIPYSHVMHLATELRGQLRSDVTPFEVASACFPRGTLSGAPKIRAMQHLANLELERRGFYAGCVGYFDVTGAMDAAIAIRAAMIKDGVASINAGAGIVYDSDPVAEYEETRSKASAVASAIEWATQLENAADSASPNLTAPKLNAPKPNAPKPNARGQLV